MMRHGNGNLLPGGRAVRGLVLAFGMSAVGFGAMEPFFVLWGHRDAGLVGSAAGLLFVAQAVGEITGGLAGGVLADRIGGRQVLVASTVGMTVAYGSLFAVHGPAPAIILIYLAGVFEAGYHPTAFALIGRLTPSEERATAYGVVRAAGNLGTIIGPLAGAAVVAGASLADVFLVAGGLLAASGVVALLTVPRRGLQVSLAEEAEEIRDAVPGVRAILRDRRLGLLVGAGGLLAITLAWWEADGLVIVHTQRHFGTSQFSIMLALSAAVVVVIQIPVTRLTRGRSVGAMLAGGGMLQAVGLALLAAASAGLVFVIAGVVLIAFGQTLYGPTLNAFVSEIAPRGREATYQAAVSTTNDIGQAIGPASGLALSAGIGARPLWILALPLGLGAGLACRRAGSGSRPGSVPVPVPVPVPEPPSGPVPPSVATPDDVPSR